MRILIVDKTAGLKASHERHQALGAIDGVQLHVLGPRRWIENGREVVWRPAPDCHYTAHLGSTFGKDYYARAGYYSGLLRAMLRSKPEIIQLLEEPWSISALQTALAASIFAPRARIIFYTWENIYRPWVYPSRASRLYAVIDRFLHHRSAAAVCATSGADVVMRKKGYSKPTCVIPYGIPGFFFEEADAEPRLDTQFTVGYLGRFLSMKGIDLLIDAVAALPGTRLVLAGSGEGEAQFREQCQQRGIADRVKWRAPMPEHLVPEFLRQLDVFVLPSRTTEGWSEQLGRAVIEAMACGVPAIGANSGAIPEVIGGAGLLFEENSVQSLIEKINQLHNCAPERNRLRHAGRARALERFTWNRFADDLYLFYRTLS